MTHRVQMKNTLGCQTFGMSAREESQLFFSFSKQRSLKGFTSTQTYTHHLQSMRERNIEQFAAFPQPPEFNFPYFSAAPGGFSLFLFTGLQGALTYISVNDSGQ